MNRKAVTIIELAMLILVVAILSIVVMPQFIASLNANRLEGAKWKLKADILYARNLAVTQQTRHGVVFNPALETYSVYRINTSTIVKDPLTTLAFTVDYANDPNFKGIGLVSTSFGSPTTNQVEFDSYGAPYSNASDILVSDGTVTLSSGGSSVIVTVTKNTGKVN